MCFPVDSVLVWIWVCRGVGEGIAYSEMDMMICNGYGYGSGWYGGCGRIVMKCYRNSLKPSTGEIHSIPGSNCDDELIFDTL